MEITALRQSIANQNIAEVVPALCEVRQRSLAGDTTVTAALQDDLLANFGARQPLFRDAMVLTVGKALYAEPALREKVVTMLQDQDPRLRASAAHAIGHMFANGNALGATLVPLLRDPQPEVRGRAAQALGRVQYRPAIPLLNRLKSDVGVAQPCATTVGQYADDALEILALDAE